MRDWSVPQRQSPAALLITMMKLLRNLSSAFAPILIGIFLAGSKKKKSVVVLIIAAAITSLISLLLSLINYLFFKFHIEEGQLVIQRNILGRKKIHIPLERIQAVHFEQKIWNTITGTTRLIIDTPGTDKAEVSIDALSLADARSLREILLSEKSGQSLETSGEENIVTPVMKTGIADLIKLSFTANHLKSLGIISAFILARLQDAGEIFKADTWGWLQSKSGSIDLGWKIITALIITSMIISLIVSIAATVLRYFDFTLKKSRTDLQARWGLLQIKQVIIPLRKIQVIQWNSNFIRSRMGIYVMKIRESVNIAENVSDSKKIELKVPVFSKKELKWMLDCYQQELPSDQISASEINKLYATRRIILLGIPMIILSCLSHCWISWYSLIPLVISIYFIMTTLVFRKRFRFWASDKGLQVLSGIWGENNSLINWEKVQFVKTSQSLFQKRKGLSNIVFHTAGGSIKLPYIKKEDAEFLLNYALWRIEAGNKNWM